MHEHAAVRNMSARRIHVRRRGAMPNRPSGRLASPPGEERELTIDALAAGGDGVGRGADGKVMFVARTAPGERIRAAVVQETSSYARGELRAVLDPSPARRPAPCPAFEAGCGGCQWLHVDEAAQHAAKQALVAAALRQLPALEVLPIATPVPPLGWRRRARFHLHGGRLGLYAAKSRQLVELARCPQLDPRLEAALPAIAAAAPPDGELALAVGQGDRIALAHPVAWPGAAALCGRAGIVGVAAGIQRFGDPVLELEPGLWGRADAFAQASAEGNAAILAAVTAALGPGEGRPLLELYAGSGNLTRALLAAGWRVTASDAVAPVAPLPGVELIVGDAAAALRQLAPRRGQLAAAVLDPPRTGAREILEALAELAPPRIVYVSCDAATLARDAAALERRGYRALRAQPIDTMPQTSHLEIVLTLERRDPPSAAP
jgi:23S rRNA (uracil1939-C5)-methyltransferase